MAVISQSNTFEFTFLFKKKKKKLSITYISVSKPCRSMQYDWQVKHASYQALSTLFPLRCLSLILYGLLNSEWHWDIRSYANEELLKVNDGLTTAFTFINLTLKSPKGILCSHR